MNSLRYLKISVFSFLVMLTLFPAAALAEEEAENIAAAADRLILPYAKAAVLIEANTGQILFSHNSDTPLPPASTTKILTTLLAIDMQPNMQAAHLISEDAAAVGDSSIDLRAGESLTLKDLICGALVRSGNDACYAIAEIIAGSEPFFVHMMNMKAAVLGAFSVHAANTNGLPDDTHVISAEDLALLGSLGLKKELFAETVSAKYVQIGEGSSLRHYQNTNKLLWQDDNIIGIKTGTTDAAGPCLAAAYRDGAATYISVVLNSPDRYGESYSLLKYAAEEYMLIHFPCGGRTVACLPRGKEYLRFRAEEDILAPVREDEAESLRWHWRIDEKNASLCLLDSGGNILSETALTAY